MIHLTRDTSLFSCENSFLRHFCEIRTNLVHLLYLTMDSPTTTTTTNGLTPPVTPEARDPNAVHEIGIFRGNNPPVGNASEAKALDDGDANMDNTVDTQATTLTEDSMDESSAADNIARSECESLIIQVDQATADFGPDDDIDIGKSIVTRKNVSAVVEEMDTPCNIDEYNLECSHNIEDVGKTLGTKECRICFVNNRELSMEMAKRCLQQKIVDLEHQNHIQNVELLKLKVDHKESQMTVTSLEGQLKAMKISSTIPGAWNGIRDQYIEAESQLYSAQCEIKRLKEEVRRKQAELDEAVRRCNAVDKLNHSTQQDCNELKHTVRNLLHNEPEAPLANLLFNALRQLEELTARVVCLHKSVAPETGTVVYQCQKDKIVNRWWVAANGKQSPLDAQVSFKRNPKNMDAYRVCYIRDEVHNDFSRAQATEAAAFSHHLNGAFCKAQKDLMNLAREVNKQNPVGKRSQVRRSAFASVDAEHWPDYDDKMARLPIGQRPRQATMRKDNRRSSSASPARRVTVSGANDVPLGKRSSSTSPDSKKAHKSTDDGSFKIPKVKSVVTKVVRK